MSTAKQRLATEAECSLSTIRLFEAGFTPTRSPTRERIQRVLDELEKRHAGAGRVSERPPQRKLAEEAITDPDAGFALSNGNGNSHHRAAAARFTRNGDVSVARGLG